MADVKTIDQLDETTVVASDNWMTILVDDGAGGYISKKVSPETLSNWMKSIAYTELTGTDVTVNPNLSYKWTATGTCTLTASGWTSGNDESCSIILTKEAGATISGSGITIMDTPSVGVNYCFIRNLPDGAKFFVSYLE